MSGRADVTIDLNGDASADPVSIFYEPGKDEPDYILFHVMGEAGDVVRILFEGCRNRPKFGCGHKKSNDHKKGPFRNRWWTDGNRLQGRGEFKREFDKKETIPVRTGKINQKESYCWKYTVIRNASSKEVENDPRVSGKRGGGKKEDDPCLDVTAEDAKSAQ